MHNFSIFMIVFAAVLIIICTALLCLNIYAGRWGWAILSATCIIVNGGVIAMQLQVLRLLK